MCVLIKINCFSQYYELKNYHERKNVTLIRLCFNQGDISKCLRDTAFRILARFNVKG